MSWQKNKEHNPTKNKQKTDQNQEWQKIKSEVDRKGQKEEQMSIMKTTTLSTQTSVAPLPLNETARKQALMRILCHAEALRLKNDNTTVEVSIDKNYRYRVAFTRAKIGSKRKTTIVTHYNTRKHAVMSLTRFVGKIDRIKPISIPLCPYCNRPTTLKEMSVNDPQGSRFRYECVPCRAWVWCHSDTAIPMGSPAKKELREKRSEAHRIVAEITGKEGIEVRAAYAHLASKMKMPKNEAHMGHMDEAECDEAIRILTVFRDELYSERNRRHAL